MCSILLYMKRTALSLSLIVIPILGIMASKAFAADSHIEVHTSGNGSVNVHSDVQEHSSSNVTNSNSATGHTSVTIESNGETKTYESDTPEDVHMQSSDGGA